MQKFNIDISQPRGPLVIYASQADSYSRFFAVTVTDNGAAYEPPTGAIYTVRFGAPGMPAGWYDTITEVGGGTHPAVVVDENTYTVEIAEQALGTTGENALVLIVSDATGYTLASWAFVLQVARVPGYDAPEATVYYNALSEQVAQVLAKAQAAAASAVLAESWAVGGTGTRPGEDTNNAEYWASEAQRVSQGALGWYETEQALQAAHPTGTDGQWAIIGSTDTIWTWDSDTNAWVNSGSTADLSNYYTKEQSDTRFATAAQGTKADSAVQSVNGLPGPNPSLTAVNVGAAPAENGVNVYIHSRTGTVNNFAGSGANGRAKMTADVQAGDTFTVNGAPVAAYIGAEDAADSMAGSSWNGKWVGFVYEDSALNIFGGGGEKVESGVVFVSALTSMASPPAYKTFETYFFNSSGVCQKPCKIRFYTAVGWNVTYDDYVFGVTVNGSLKLSTTAQQITTNNLVSDIGVLEISVGDVVSAYFSMPTSNQRGGAIIGILEPSE